jgi:putative oxidoreductase
MSAAAMLLALRLAGGSVFVVFGAGKFVNHASELASFKSYGLPAPELFVLVIGVIELIGGVFLIVGILARPAALVLAGDMVGAIVVSGIGRGELVSLTLAPAELVICLFLVWTGPGMWSLDRWFAGLGRGAGTRSASGLAHARHPAARQPPQCHCQDQPATVEELLHEARGA